MIHKFVSNLSPLGKKIFNFAVVLVTLAVFDRLFLGPMISRVNVLDTEIDQQISIVKQDQRLLRYKDQIIQRHQSFSKYYQETIQDQDVINADFLSLIEKMATKSNVGLVKSNPTEAKKEDDFVEYYANLDCAGNLSDMIGFMHMINTSDELLKIVRFNLTPKRGTDNEVNASMTIAKLVVNPN